MPNIIMADQKGGGYTNDDFADTTKPVGAVTFSYTATSANGYTYLLAHRTGITEINFPNAILIPDYIASNCTSLSTVTAPKAQTLGEYAFEGCSALQRVVFPVATRVYSSVFQDCSNLIAADFGGTPASGEGLWRSQIFKGCSKLNILVIRGSAVWALAAVNVFTNSPFASGKAGGTLYVPAALISDYQAATNWSVILGYTNNQIKSIESTATDPDAPVDLTTHYIDGTLITA